MKKILILHILFFAFTVKGQKVVEMVIPKSISQITTLKGERENEIWELKFAKDFPNIEVKIFDKWGKLVFHDKRGYLKGWNGTFKGENLPFDKYYYIIDLNDKAHPNEIKGTIRFNRK